MEIMTMTTPQAIRLAEIRAEIDAERVSYGELAELADLAPFIDGDIVLAEWAGIPEADFNSGAYQADGYTIPDGSQAE